MNAGPDEGRVTRRRNSASDDQRFAIIQSFSLDDGRGPTIATCAGTGDLAALASVKFLLTHWRRIAQECRRQPFAITLAVDAKTGIARYRSALVAGRPFVL